MNNKNQPSKSAHLNSGVAHHRAGKLLEAEACYKAALQVDEKNFEAWHLLGVVAAQKNQSIEAIKLISHSISLNPQNPEALNNLGLIHAGIGQCEEAISSYNSAIALNPNYFEAFNNRGNAQQALFKFEEAISSYNSAIAIDPNYFEAFNNRGNAQEALLKFEEAISSYDSALAISPNYADAWYNKGVLFQSLKRYEDALKCYDQTLSLEPNFAECLNNKGDIFNDLGLQQKSYEFYEMAIAINPEHLPARFGSALSSIPKIFASAQDIQASRDELSERLKKLKNWVYSHNLEDGYNVVGIHQPFFLAYQERNNAALLTEYGDICQYLMKPLQTMVDASPNQHFSKSGKIRVGIVSNHFHNHSVWNAITKGFIQNINKSQFEIHSFSIDSKADKETEIAKQYSDSFSENVPTIEGWIKRILDKKIEVLLFPEIGMDKITFQLANLRLAPLQIVAWGHPETTGIPTIDCFLSAALFENENSPDHYTENLLPLPNLGCYFNPRNDPTKTINLEDFGLDHTRPILLSPGVPFKYSPDNDHVIISLARRIPNVQIVFFNFPSSSIEIFKARLTAKFSSEAMDFNHSIKFLPLLDPPLFKGLMEKSDLFIDTIGFSGFNTAMQAIECNLPIVTREGRFMRGNLAAGILKRIGLAELIAHGTESYIELIAKLATSPALVNQYAKEISVNKHVLFSDLTPVRYLESFLLKECRNITT